jgi:hypothetical protein
MIAREDIQEAKEVTTGGGVDDLIYPREWIRILGQALLRLVKSTQRRPLPLAFGTTTGLAIQVGWATSRINLAFFSFSISWTIKSCFSCACFLVFYFTGCA